MFVAEDDNCGSEQELRDLSCGVEAEGAATIITIDDAVESHLARCCNLANDEGKEEKGKGAARLELARQR